MRVRGLKLTGCGMTAVGGAVAPHAGAWIEISCRCFLVVDESVAPHAGAWIEIRLCLYP